MEHASYARHAFVSVGTAGRYRERSKHLTHIPKLRETNCADRTLHLGGVQQLSAGGNLVESAERIARLVEGFRAAGFPCGLLGLPRLARSMGEQIVFRPAALLREAMAQRFHLHTRLR